MLSSMTGFGRGISGDNLCSYVVEIKSVNHRFQEISVKMSRNLMSLEEKIRNNVKEKIKRGKVDIFITEKNYEDVSTEINLNLNLAKSYENCLETLKNNFELKDDISVCNLAKFPDIIKLSQKEEDIEEKWVYIEKALNDGIENLINMRMAEGVKLQEDLLQKCENILNLVYNINKKAPKVVSEYKKKLDLKISDLLQEKVKIDESRLAMEVAIFADKASIDEEITRLKSHVNQMQETLKEEGSIGRKLDFIVQEMNREANTIASKANDLDIITYTLELKSEIEKIREQVQNIQ